MGVYDQASRLDMVLPEWSDAGLSLQVVQGTQRTEDAKPTLARLARGELYHWVLAWLPLLLGAVDTVNMAEWKRLATEEAESCSRS